LILTTVTVSQSQWFSSTSIYAASENEQVVFDYLVNHMGFNEAAATGIVANIHYESGCNPLAEGDSGTSYGICQWHADRKAALIDYCQQNGYDYTTLEGQLHYLEQELNSSYQFVYTHLMSVENSEEGVEDATTYWCKYFEVPAYADLKAAQRTDYALKTYWPMFKPVELDLTEAKETAISDIETYKNLEDYYTVEQEKIQAIQADFENQVEAITTEVDLSEALTAAKAQLDAVVTKTDLGDINEDQTINSLDGLAALKSSVDLDKLTEDQFNRGDINRDGDVNSTDALGILQFSVELIDQF